MSELVDSIARHAPSDDKERRDKDAKLRVLLGRLRLRDGDPKAALKWFQEAARVDPDYAYAHLSLAEVYDKLGDDPALITALSIPLRTAQRNFGEARRWLFEKLEK